MYRHCRVREISPGTHTFFRTYTCPVYCWRSVQLLDFSLYGGLIHASQPIRDFCSSGQCFASGFLQTPPHDDALASGCILPTAGQIRDFHRLERAPAGRTIKKGTLRMRPLCKRPSYQPKMIICTSKPPRSRSHPPAHPFCAGTAEHRDGQASFCPPGTDPFQ